MLRHPCIGRRDGSGREDGQVREISRAPTPGLPGTPRAKSGAMAFAFVRSRVLAASIAVLVSTSLSSAPVFAASRNVERFDVKVANSSMDAGAARVRAHAPASTLR